MTRLREHYDNVVKPELIKQFGYANPMQVPKLEKVVINMGVGEASQDRKLIKGAVEEMTLISGQQPVITKAKKSIAAYKLRDGMTVGCKVTLRRERMYEFIDRLLTIALPRVRDFRGLSGNSFDGKGNYALGLKEQIVFPEIDYDRIDKIRGMDIVICTTAKTDDEASALLSGFDFPFSGRDAAKEAEEEAAKKAETEAARLAAKEAVAEAAPEPESMHKEEETAPESAGDADEPKSGSDGEKQDG